MNEDYTVTELAREAGCDVSLIRHLFRRGELERYKRGNMSFIPRPAGDKWLKERKRKKAKTGKCSE
jgi:hypothetical protein